MLHEKQLKCIEMLVTGDWTKSEIARQIDISRQAIYDWLDNNAEFKSELDKRLQQIKTQTQRNYVSKLPKAIE
ncbi:MAG: phBC6A51 family helix-turn-helix protein, partial [Candidatus Methanomethyliaceae archaeon]|nr:phBC6A51 family helix-turn-helix protein [Candidatus Methanomethyliaceae archaeon]